MGKASKIDDWIRTLQHLIKSSLLRGATQTKTQTLTTLQKMKTEIKLTELETKTLNWLKNEGWYNWSGEPHFSDVEAQDVSNGTGININSLKGVLGSLSKKGFIFVEEMDVNAENYDYYGDSDFWY
jgi:hypothetical protein